MNFKTLWTNYKIYGVMIGIVLGTIVYNMISMDFSFSQIESIEHIDFWNTYVYLVMRMMRFYICILLISFFKIREKLYAVVLGIESFQLAGSIVILIRLHNMMHSGSVIESLLKIVLIYFFMKNEKPVLNKIFAFMILVLGILAEIFLIYFL